MYSPTSMLKPAKLESSNLAKWLNVKSLQIQGENVFECLCCSAYYSVQQSEFSGGRNFSPLQLSQNLHHFWPQSLYIISNNSRISAEWIAFIWKWLCYSFSTTATVKWSSHGWFQLLSTKYNCLTYKKVIVTLETLLWKIHTWVVRSSCFGTYPAFKTGIK